jgi:cyclopropane fatty-acyl-phospholipid synthase-like methyltransferase
VKHRGGLQTEEHYRGVPVHAAANVHHEIVELLRRRLPPGARVADVGAGHGALSLRLRDSGFAVAAFDLDCSDWLVPDVACHSCDVNESLGAIAAEGPFDAICVIEVIDHLENPRRFLHDVIELRRAEGTWLIISMPNPLDTFSCIAMFTRGIFSWASPAHYEGGGHISILPHWLIAEHLRYLGVTHQEWHFLAPYRHPSVSKRIIYQCVSRLRRMLSRGGDESFFEGQTALVVARL